MKKNKCFPFFYVFFCISLCVSIKAEEPQSSFQALSLFSSPQTRVGFGLAGEYLNVESHLTVVPSPGLNDDDADIGTKQSQTGKRFQIAPYIELGNTFKNNYYLGLLVGWRYSGSKNTARSTIEGTQYFQHKFALKHSTDIFIKAGYQFIPKAMVYGLIGMSLTQWEHTSLQFGDHQNIIGEFKTKKIAPGLGFGVGFEYCIRKDYVVGIDYKYHFQKRESKSQSMSYTTLDALGYVHPGVPVVNVHSGNLNRKIDLSYATIAVRFTALFSL